MYFPRKSGNNGGVAMLAEQSGLTCSGTGQQMASYSWTAPRKGNYYISVYGTTSYASGYYRSAIYVNDTVADYVTNDQMGIIVSLNAGDVVTFSGACNNNNATSRTLNIKIVGIE